MVEAVVGWKGLSGSAWGRSRRRASTGIVGVREMASIDWGDWCMDYKAIEEAT